MFVDNSANAGTSKATVVDSVSANNVNHGFIAGGGGAFLTIIHSASIGNNNFVVTFDAGTVLRFGHSTLSRNIASWTAVGGTLQSFGDNYITGNGDGDPAPPAIPTK